MHHFYNSRRSCEYQFGAKSDVVIMFGRMTSNKIDMFGCGCYAGMNKLGEGIG